MDQDDHQLERFEKMYVLVDVIKISLVMYFTILKNSAWWYENKDLSYVKDFRNESQFFC